MSKKPTILDRFVDLAIIKPTLMLYIVNDNRSIYPKVKEVMDSLKHTFRFISAHGHHLNIINIPYLVQPVQQHESQIKFISFVEITHFPGILNGYNPDLIICDDRVESIIKASHEILDASKRACLKRDGELPSENNFKEVP